MILRRFVRIAAAWLTLIAIAVPIPPLFPPRFAAQAQALPALPQTYLNTAYAPPSGSVITVPAGGDFQSALNNAGPGDTITLAAGATYTGTFTLPAKSGSGWIYIQSSALSSLPAPGTRVSPTQASAMPKILGPSGSLALWGAPGAHHFRFVGIEFSPAARAVQSVVAGWQDPTMSCLVPGDIEVRGNSMTKRLAWREFDPSFAGTLVTVKEVFELKNARRVLIDGNIFEHSWKQSDHDGHAIQFTPRNQTGGAPWSLVEDVTFTHNIVRQATNGFFMLGTDYTHPSGPLQRVLIQNNLIYGIGSFPENGSAFWFGALLIMRDGVTAVTFDHNTAFQSGDVLHASAVNHTPNTGLVFTNNVGDGNVSSEAAAGPAAALATSFPGAVFTRNVLLNGNTSAYPAGNWFPPG